MAMPTEPLNETNLQSSDRRALKVAGATFVFLAVATIAFAVSYTTAASLTHSHASDVSQTAAAAATASSTAPDPFSKVTLLAKSAIVIDETTHETLFTLNPDVQLPLASLTKLAMALSVSQVLGPNQIITIPYNTPPTYDAAPLTKGMQFRERDLMNFTLVASDNQGADILSQAANQKLHQLYPQSSAASSTVWRMNDLARQLGLVNTFFLNDNGLDISTTQSGGYGSARDVATLIDYAASTSLPVFRATTQPSITVPTLSGETVTATNTNEALPDIPDIIMGKTGYTDLAGGNLAVVFQAGGQRIVAVVLGSTFHGRFDDMRELVDATQKAIAQGRL